MKVDDPNSTIVLGQIIGSDVLLGLTFALGIFAVVAVSGVVMARKETRSVARIARDRARKMNELLRTIRMAESIAELGVWQYDPVHQQQQWSEGMRALFGIEQGENFVAGDAETLLFANQVDLIGGVSLHKDAREPFELRFDITGFDGIARSLSVQACNLRNSRDTIIRVVAVVRDVTDQVTRERHLEQSRAQALSEARRAKLLAETDELTGLSNRRAVMARLDQLLLEARGSGAPLSLITFDIDHFKAVNDSHGHLSGDLVLQRVAAIANEQARDTDLVGRIGGEEFVWIVPGADDALARIMAERLRQAIALGSSAGPVPSVTASVGIAALDKGDTSLALFARADNALYEAKNSGRNRVRMAA